MNSIFAIHPYRHEGLWVFDDEGAGLRQEPFVSGADVIIDRMTENIPNAEQGFTLIFSDRPFPGYQECFQRRRLEYGGAWYYSPQLDLEGWLCPALFQYFKEPPEEIYAEFRAKRGDNGAS